MDKELLEQMNLHQSVLAELENAALEGKTLPEIRIYFQEKITELKNRLEKLSRSKQIPKQGKSAPREIAAAGQPIILEQKTEKALSQTIEFFRENSVSALLYLGVFIFSAALAVFVRSQWHSMTALSKVGILGMGSLTMLGLGWFTRVKFKLPSTAIAFTALGAFSIPIDIYAAVYYGLFNWDENLLGFVSGLACTGFYVFLDRRLQSELFVYGAYAALTSALWFFCAFFSFQPEVTLNCLASCALICHLICGAKPSFMPAHYFRPLFWSTQALVLSCLLYFAFLHSTFPNDLERAIPMLYASLVFIIFYESNARRLGQFSLLIVSTLCQFVFLLDLHSWQKFDSITLTFVFSVWAFLLHAASLPYAMTTPTKEGGPNSPHDILKTYYKTFGALIFSICLPLMAGLSFSGQSPQDFLLASISFYAAAFGAGSHLLRKCGEISSHFALMLLFFAAFFLLKSFDLRNDVIYLLLSPLAVGYGLLEVFNFGEKRKQIAIAGFHLFVVYSLIQIINTLEHRNLFSTSAAFCHLFSCLTLSAGWLLKGFRLSEGRYSIPAFALVLAGTHAIITVMGFTWPQSSLLLLAGGFFGLALPENKLRHCANARIFILVMATCASFVDFCQNRPEYESPLLALALYFFATGLLWLPEIFWKRNEGGAHVLLTLWGLAYYCLAGHYYHDPVLPIVWAAYPAFLLALWGASIQGPLKILNDAAQTHFILAGVILFWFTRIVSGDHFYWILPEEARFFESVMAILLLGFGILRANTPKLKGSAVFLASVYGFSALRSTLQVFEIAPELQILCLQIIPAVAFGLLVWANKRALPNIINGASFAILFCQLLTVYLGRETQTALAMSMFFAACGSAALAVLHRKTFGDLLIIASAAEFQIAYMTFLQAAKMSALPSFILLISLFGLLQSILARYMPERWGWRNTLRWASLFSTLHTALILLQNFNAIPEEFGHYAAFGLLVVSLTYFLLYRLDGNAAFAAFGALALLMSYYTELGHWKIETWEAYTVPPGLVLAACAFWAKRKNNLQLQKNFSIPTGWILIAPSFLQALPLETGNPHSLYTLILCVLVLIFSMRLLGKGMFILANSSFVLLVLIKAAQYLHIERLARAQWGMLIGGILIFAGAGVELYRKGFFDTRIEKCKAALHSYFKDWN